MVIEGQVKTHHKPNQDNSKKKHLKPCRIHNGGYEWDDCWQNPKNNENDENIRTMEIIAMEEETRTTVDLEKKTDTLKEIGDDPPEKEPEIEAMATREKRIPALTVKMNIIASEISVKSQKITH